MFGIVTRRSHAGHGLVPLLDGLDEAGMCWVRSFVQTATTAGRYRSSASTSAPSVKPPLTIRLWAIRTSPGGVRRRARNARMGGSTMTKSAGCCSGMASATVPSDASVVLSYQRRQ